MSQIKAALRGVTNFESHANIHTRDLALISKATEHRASHSTPQSMGSGWPFVLTGIAGLAASGWIYLGVMLVDMVPRMDMSEAGPGMAIFNQFNMFRGMPAEARAALAALCLPTASTFGMPGPDLNMADIARIFVMWLMMALAMMLPGAVPMLRAYACHLSAKPKRSRIIFAPVALAAAGYLSTWVIYAAVATGAQIVLQSFGTLNPMMAPFSLAFTTSVLAAAGLYQFTPAKAACLKRCWHPRWIFQADNADGLLLGFREGHVQGRICLGCCWAVMTVMFAVGVMNILWIAILGSVMALEKSIASMLLPRLIGALLLGWALVLFGLIIL